jgi:valine--pyruvate aminotransferase
MKYSKFGTKFTQPNGITQLMDDLGKANQSGNPDIIMLGGGNPALIPESHAVFVKELEKLIASSEVDNMMGLYDGPEGDDNFRKAMASLLSDHYGWELTEKNISLSNGSQSSFFSLFNLLAGEMPDGSTHQILFPLAPEYVGYADQGLSDDMFVSIKPDIHVYEDAKQFKYQIDIEALELKLENERNTIGAICVSRPTNPTGNVITDDELAQLNVLAKQYEIPIIIDNAYGHPFPGSIYTDAKLTWNSNTILCMSLSKLGLPGLRTGIVIANEDIIQAMGRISGIMTLAPNSVGPSLLLRLMKDKELMALSNKVIKPYYQKKSETAIALFNEIFADLPVYLHKLEGAFFMWLWFKDLGIKCEALYEELKKQDVYIIPGHNFFIGIDDSWEHKHQCIRINYAKDEAVLRKGLEAVKAALEKKLIN